MEKSLFEYQRKRLKKGKGFHSARHLNSSLPLIHPPQLNLFQTKQNLSNISNYFYNEDEELVRQLDIKKEPPHFYFKLNLRKKNFENRSKYNSFQSVALKLNGSKSSTYEETKLREQNRRFQLERIKITAKENELKSSLNELKQKLEHEKNEKEKVTQQILTLLKLNDERKFKLDTLTKKSKQSKEFIALLNFNKDYKYIQDNRIQIGKDIQATVFQVNNLQQQLTNIKENASKLKQQIKDVKSELIQHYHNLLCEGIDTRQEGLSWIIRAIWNQKEEVALNYLPNFLDTKAIEFLFEISRKYQTLSDLQLSLNEIMAESSNLHFEYKPPFFDTGLNFRKQGILYRSNSVVNLKRTKNSLDFMKEMKKVYERRDQPTKCSLRNIISHREKEQNEQTFQNADKIQMMRTKIEKLEKEIRLMKEREMERITKEFMSNDYAKRFQISQEFVIGTLIGEDNKHAEMLRQQKRKKEILQNLKKCSFYKKCNLGLGKYIV